MQRSPQELKVLLKQVLWIGGTPDSGKTSIADALAEKHGLQVYHFDRHEMEHFRQADPVLHPNLTAAHPDVMGPEERWLGSTPDEMCRQTMACWTERFSMAVEDLLRMPGSPGIIAEGPGMYPDAVVPLIEDSRRAVWLLPSEAFKRESIERRQKLRSLPVSDIERAVENLIQRDLLMTAEVRRQVEAHGVIAFDVDGSRDLKAMLALVEAHFGL